MIVKTGDVIRSYDFKPMVGRPDCYVEGKVVEQGLLKCGYDAYLIKVTYDSWNEDSDGVKIKGRVGKNVFVPMEVSYMDFPGRVMNLSRI
jgi:hypothetical protein